MTIIRLLAFSLLKVHHPKALNGIIGEKAIGVFLVRQAKTFASPNNGKFFNYFEIS
jgi:hypothetical protein